MRTLALLFALFCSALTLRAQSLEKLSEAVSQKTRRDDLDTISHVIRADFNRDGQSDIAAVFTRAPRFDETGTDTAAYSSRWLAIAFGQPNGLSLSLCAPVIQCPVCGGDMNDPLSKLEWQGNEFYLEYDAGSVDRTTLSYRFQWLKEDWVVSEMGQRSYNLLNLFSDFSKVNYLNYLSNRSCAPPLVVDENGKPLTEKPMFEHSVDFFAFFPKKVEKGPRLDGFSEEADWQRAPLVDVHDKNWIVQGAEHWTNNADLSFEARSLWEDDSLYLFVRVNDDALVPTGKDPQQLMKSDHVELWFDFRNYDMDFSGAYPKLRNEPDITTAQLAIGFREDGSVLAQVWYPQTGFEADGVRGRAERLPEGNGYTLEIALPKNLLMKLDRRKDAREKLFLEPNSRFTLVVSDNDDPAFRKAETVMATSQLRPGDPSSMGTLLPIEEFNLLRLEEMVDIF
jgi:hypothetical protein